MDTNKAALFRTIPNTGVALGTTELDLSKVTTAIGKAGTYDLRGKFVYIQNESGGDLTLLRGDPQMGAPTATSGGFVVKNGVREEFYVNPDPKVSTVVRGSATGLTIWFDTND